MSSSLGFGLTKPSNQDSSSIWWPLLLAFWDWAAAHTHNGTNSATVDETALVKDIAQGDWGSIDATTGLYTLTADADTPLNGTANITFADYQKSVVRRDGTDSGEPVFPSFNRVTATTFNLTSSLNVAMRVRFY